MKYQAIPFLAAILAGTGVGLVSGLTGVGGGVPVLLLLRWASPECVANLSGPFILANSLLGFAGTQIAGQPVSSNILIYAVAALAGAAIGGSIWHRLMSDSSIRIVLAAVLVIAGSRLIFSGLVRLVQARQLATTQRPIFSSLRMHRISLISCPWQR